MAEGKIKIYFSDSFKIAIFTPQDITSRSECKGRGRNEINFADIKKSDYGGYLEIGKITMNGMSLLKSNMDE